MEQLQIFTGMISLEILDDEGKQRGIFRFNPTDMTLCKNIFDLQSSFKKKENEVKAQLANCEDNKDKLEIVCEICDYYNEQIDNIFGEGSCDILFGKSKSLFQYIQFFEGVTPYIAGARKKQMDKYRNYQ